ncbi:MAG: zf-HC2 domain-containing protein [Mycobacteriaceae bacterium]|nr:zf-HC2 domain-containing protein [Mycobacteriaceae bacterium]
MWDAAYVLGSLSSDDRREYEAHLATCAECRDAVSELCGMPALLSRLGSDEVAAIDDGDAGTSQPTPPLRPQMLNSLLDKVSWRRRRAKMLSWTVGAVAAAVLVIGVFVALQATPPPSPAQLPKTEAVATTMLRVKPSALNATVTLTSHGWGTRIEMNCTYDAAPANSSSKDDEVGDKLAMVVVGRDGTQTQLATWVALTGVPATPGGSTSMPMDEISAVQIVSADSGEVLLQRSL